MSQAQLFGDDAGDEPDERRPSAGSSEAASLAAWLEMTNTSDDAVAHLAEAATLVAENHPLLAPAEALAQVLGLHERVRVLLHGKQRERQRRELFGIQSGLLAHVCLLLGDRQQTGTAQRCRRARRARGIGPEFVQLGVAACPAGLPGSQRRRAGRRP
jgi:hypothetical protein